MSEELCNVHVNTDPDKGPLDGAEATVMIAKTVFKEGSDEFTQEKIAARIQASYELGVVSISILDENVLITARIDEMMQVMFASAEAMKAITADKQQIRKR